MKYIKISNKGEIEVNAFKLIGASTKRDDDTKIGFFGSGLKYAMAYLLRNKIEFEIYSGDRKIDITTKKVDYRGQSFNTIVIDGTETSMTTEMGPSWALWFAIRELYCNALDEGGSSIDIVGEISQEPGYTSFYIKMNPEVMNIVDHWDMYFSMTRPGVIYNSNGVKLYLRNPYGVLVYRRGVQCYFEENTSSIFDYDMPNITINESRVIDNIYVFRRDVVRFFAMCPDAKILKTLLNTLDKGGREKSQFEWDMPWDDIYQISELAWKEAIGTRILVHAETAGYYEDIITGDRDNYLLLPKCLVDVFENIDGFEVLGESTNGVRYKKVPTLTKKQKFLLSEVFKFFEESGYKVNGEVEVVNFQQKNVKGTVKDKNTILISESLFDEGKRKIAEVIWEESEHISSGESDCTRAFQNHIISKVISQMEERVAFFL